MTGLDQNQAWDRSYELVAHDKLGNDFRLLSNTAYMAVEWLSFLRSKSINGDKLAKQVADDLEAAILATLQRDRDFDEAVAKAMPSIKKRAEKYVKRRLRQKKFIGQEYYVRAYLAANTIDVVGEYLDL